MEDVPANKPPRRPRYRGKNPRAFHEKYKELHPERYPDDIHKIISGGNTPAGSHRPIMVREILQVLALQPGQVAVDCTLGYGGHSRELLAAVQPNGKLLAVDADPIELPKTEARLRALAHPAESLIVRRMNFAGIAQFIATESPSGADAILADLGVSSMQLDNPARGFTFKADGPLDMRMNPARGLSASALLSKLNSKKLATILTDNADEPFASQLSEAILAAHTQQPLTTTGSLATIVRDTLAPFPRLGKDAIELTVRRVFQAIRIEVNDEFGSLDAFLRLLPDCLKPGGRVAILTFHSGEDRRVKAAFKQGLHDGVYQTIADEVIRAAPEEQRSNPRSASAKLRFAVKADA